MLVGTTLPQFGDDAEAAVRMAQRAEDLGLDGVFVFNHLWPIGRPDGSVLECHTLLAVLAAETERVRIGPLVARIGLLPDAVLLHILTSLQRMAGDRLIAALGAGDRLSAAENLAYGIDYPPAEERLAAVETVCRALRTEGIETWVGGRSSGVRRIVAVAADALNVWDATPEQVRAEGTGLPRVTWGGQLDLSTLSVADVAARLQEVEAAGADFAVCAPINTPWESALETLSGARTLVH